MLQFIEESQVYFSLIRIILGHLLGYSLALILALILFCFTKKLSKILQIAISFIASIPVIILLPILIEWFGIEDGTRIIFISIPTFELMFLFSMYGFHAIENKYFELSYLSKHSVLDKIEYILLPHSSNIRVIGQRISLVLGWLTLCIVESSLGDSQEGGIGYKIVRAYEWVQEDVLYYNVLILIIVSSVVDVVISKKLIQKFIRKLINFTH